MLGESGRNITYQSVLSLSLSLSYSLFWLGEIVSCVVSNFERGEMAHKSAANVAKCFEGPHHYRCNVVFGAAGQ